MTCNKRCNTCSCANNGAPIFPGDFPTFDCKKFLEDYGLNPVSDKRKIIGSGAVIINHVDEAPNENNDADLSADVQISVDASKFVSSEQVFRVDKINGSLLTVQETSPSGPVGSSARLSREIFLSLGQVYFQCPRGSGLQKSVDGGTNWDNARGNLLNARNDVALRIDPAITDKISELEARIVALENK